MAIAIALVLTLSSAQPFSAEQSPDRWLAQDKLLHVVLSGALMSAFYHFHQHECDASRASSQILAAQITISIGIAKETKDARFSYRDLIADMVGIGVGVLLFVR